MKDQTKPPTRFLDVADLTLRWSVGRQTVERWSRSDPAFPKVHRFFNSKVRKFLESDVEAYERSALSRREARG
jgi:hypothetical protein